MMIKVKKPFKGQNHKWLTLALFSETNWERTYEPVFSLHGKDPDYINCAKTFVQERDPTGYKWAMKYLGSYEHFKVLLQTTFFQDAYSQWMDQLNELLRSEAIQRVQEIMTEGQPSQSLAAAKWIATKGWEETGKTSRGRPSKSEVRGELKRQVELSEQEAADFERINLKVIEGGNSGN